MPGSPVDQALWTMRSKSRAALTFWTSRPVRGLVREKSRSSLTASMKASVRPTEMLKLVRRLVSFLQVMKASISGWSTRRMPMLAPRRVPPCLMVSVATSKMFMKEMGPEATPLVESTGSLAGRMREKEKPVPPPDLWIRAVCFTASKMLSMLSSTGKTKQAESWPSSRPAFIRVGELGMNLRDAMRS